MLKLSAFTLALVVLAIVQAVARADDEIHGVDDVDAKEVEKLAKLRPYLVKLNLKMYEKLTVPRSPESCIAVAKEELEKLNSGCMGACSMLKKNHRRALELFVSLEDTVDRCDTQSYEILYRNTIAHNAPYAPYAMLADLFVTNDVLAHYRQLHAEHCRPLYKTKFNEKLESAHRESLDRADKAFLALTVSDFGYNPVSDCDLVGMRKPTFTSEKSTEALVQITQGIKEQIKSHPDSFVANLSKPGAAISSHEPLKQVLDQYLFEPCVYYRLLLSTDLNKARYDAGVRDGAAQRDFIYGDENFHRALISNRLCGSLLEEREQLYEPLYRAWEQERHY